jgi:hypothetical protein
MNVLVLARPINSSSRGLQVLLLGIGILPQANGPHCTPNPCLVGSLLGCPWNYCPVTVNGTAGWLCRTHFALPQYRPSLFSKPTKINK